MIEVTEKTLRDGGRIIVAPMQIEDAVTIVGSVYGGWNMLSDKDAEVPGIAAQLFDAGTKRKSKKKIREFLSAHGATLSFSPGGDRLHFSITCFPEDLERVLSIAFECIALPTFPEAEVRAAKARALGELAIDATDTRTQAQTALLRMVYQPGHPNALDATPTRIKKVRSVTRASLRKYAALLGRGGLVLSIAGDVALKSAFLAAERAIRILGAGTAVPSEKQPNARSHRFEEERIAIKDKANIDVYLGAAVPLTYDHPSFTAFNALSSMLGGRGLSTGHLMRTIRERDGYTYGIYAAPRGFEDGADGAFLIWATFSPENYERALAATRSEITAFLASGITEEALSRKKTEMLGRYLLSLSTTAGRAGTLHTLGIEGKPLGYLDAYPGIITALTVADLEEAAKLVPLERLAVAAAGTFAKD